MTALAIRRFSRRAPIKASIARSCVALGACLVVAVLCSPASALDPSRHISQYGHTVWRIQDGAIDPAAEIAQTADGYLWLGSSNGLLRFDGVKLTSPTVVRDVVALSITYIFRAVSNSADVKRIERSRNLSVKAGFASYGLGFRSCPSAMN